MDNNSTERSHALKESLLIRHSTLFLWLAFLALILAVLGFTYIRDLADNQYIKTSYVYACPDEGKSKCYKVVVDFAESECWESEDRFGQPVGECKNPMPNKIFFDNGGSVDLICYEKEKEKWGCTEKNNNKLWDLQFAEIVKIKK